MENVKKNKLDSETEKYIESFYEPDFSCYDFILLFTALIAQQGLHYFDRDILQQYIYESKNQKNYNGLLGDIKFKSNGIFNYSENFDNTIFMLKCADMLYTLSPERDSKIYIHQNIDIAGIINKRVNYIEQMKEFICNYLKFSSGINNDSMSKDNKIKVLSKSDLGFKG